MSYFPAASCSAGDCDDDADYICPDIIQCPEVCDGMDNDCDSLVDEDDTEETCQDVCELLYTWLGLGDPYNCCGNTADEQPYQASEFGAVDLCDDGNDNDCDSLTDCNDPDCDGHSSFCPTMCTIPFTLPCTFP
jgi:hypothetical protein